MPHPLLPGPTCAALKDVLQWNESLEAAACLHMIPGAPERLITTYRFSFSSCVVG